MVCLPKRVPFDLKNYSRNAPTLEFPKAVGTAKDGWAIINTDADLVVPLVIYSLWRRFWLAALENHGEMHLVSLSIPKTFDRVWHEGQLATLSTFRSFMGLISQTTNIFSEWTILVRIDSSLSLPSPVNGGVLRSSAIVIVISLLSNRFNSIQWSVTRDIYHFSSSYCTLRHINSRNVRIAMSSVYHWVSKSISVQKC